MIALIVAHSKNNVIGNKGRIPWNIKGELRRYKELTTDTVSYTHLAWQISCFFNST